jgi:hypothetical protein
METRIGLYVQLDFVGMDPLDNEIHWGEVGSISLEFPEWKIAEAITALACNFFTISHSFKGKTRLKTDQQIWLQQILQNTVYAKRHGRRE